MEYRSLPFTIYPSKAKLIRLLLTAVAFTAIGVWLGAGGDSLGWFCAAFFGLGGAVFLFQFIRPTNRFLTVDERGIEFGSPTSKSRFAWSELSEFKTYAGLPYLRFQAKFVGFNFSPAYNGPAKAQGVTKAMYGFDNQLPDTYGYSAEDLAELLTYYRSVHGESAK
mgnify:CR=1 FL=1